MAIVLKVEFVLISWCNPLTFNCDPYLNKGDLCTAGGGNFCSGDLSCISGICTTKKSLEPSGGSCTLNTDCSSGFFCNDLGVCTQMGTYYDPCGPVNPCLPNLWCDTKGIKYCQLFYSRGINEKCQDNSHCQIGFYCNSFTGLCAYIQGSQYIGKTCSTTSDCGPLQVCQCSGPNTKQTCMSTLLSSKCQTYFNSYNASRKDDTKRASAYSCIDNCLQYYGPTGALFKSNPAASCSSKPVLCDAYSMLSNFSIFLTILILVVLLDM